MYNAECLDEIQSISITKQHQCDLSILPRYAPFRTVPLLHCVSCMQTFVESTVTNRCWVHSRFHSECESDKNVIAASRPLPIDMNEYAAWDRMVGKNSFSTTVALYQIWTAVEEESEDCIAELHLIRK